MIGFVLTMICRVSFLPQNILVKHYFGCYRFLLILILLFTDKYPIINTSSWAYIFIYLNFFKTLVLMKYQIHFLLKNVLLSVGNSRS